MDDYAFFIWGLLELYEASFDAGYLEAALKLNDHFLEHFWDAKSGGLYFTSNESEDLPVRKKEIYDGATPSGNSVAALNFLRLGRITANPELESKAELVGQAFSQSVNQMPSAYTMLLTAVQFALGPSSEVVISGRTGAEDTRRLAPGASASVLAQQGGTVPPLGRFNLRRLKLSHLIRSITQALTARPRHTFARISVATCPPMTRKRCLRCWN